MAFACVQNAKIGINGYVGCLNGNPEKEQVEREGGRVQMKQSRVGAVGSGTVSSTLSL